MKTKGSVYNVHLDFGAKFLRKKCALCTGKYVTTGTASFIFITQSLGWENLEGEMGRGSVEPSP